ncbi:MAG: hypothetical protein ABEI07_02430, partial [Candidatus Nanohaloarchaea archaeon]
MGKGVSPLISAVFYAGIVIAAVAIVLNMGMPVIHRMQETASIQNNIQTLTRMDRLVRTVASEGRYSTRITSIQFQSNASVATVEDV